MVKVFKSLIVAFLLMAAGITYAYANIARLVLIDYSDFRKVDSNVYLSGELYSNAEKKLEAILSGARKRINVHYGKVNATPNIVALTSQEELKKYGLNDRPAMLLLVPWGSYLLLNYKTVGIDVTAHELVHAEVVHRTGYLKRQFYIPTWFDEGAAMQVDYREKYDILAAIDASEFVELTRLDTPKKFWSSDRKQNIKNYRTAKTAVSEIFKHTSESLYSILEKVRGGNQAIIADVVNKTNLYMASGCQGKNFSHGSE